MLVKNAVVLYKNVPALVTDCASGGDKFTITWCSQPATATGKKAVYAEQKVRERDVYILCEKPVASLDALYAFADTALLPGSKVSIQLAEVHELLLSDEQTAEAPVPFPQLAELIRGRVVAEECWGIYTVLKNAYEFAEMGDSAGCVPVFIPRSAETVAALKKKADEKDHAAEIRDAFIARLKKNKLSLPDDARFMVDVEALALGKTDKSKTMHDAGMKETEERAHKLLLETGIWDITRNPYPLRWGLSMQSATEGLACPPEEDRVTVSGTAYAIDNAWSTDPDDAIAFDGVYVWVHIADPASTVLPGSTIDAAARARGATLYIPEGASRMLCEDALADYALGLNAQSRALSFRLLLDQNGDIEDCSVLRTVVTVKRLTYEQADDLYDSQDLLPLFKIADRNIKRRAAAGAVSITLPEVHIEVNPETKRVTIGPSPHPRSADVVREMMLLAGEGAARFAFKHAIPFPFISQEAPDVPSDLPPGLAGQFRLRKCMRRRNVTITPSVHAGLGLGMYSQVTSPLRRYGDLIGHEQLRAFLCGRALIDKDTMLFRMSEGDAAATASHKAERKSNTHWTLVYLLQNPDWTGDAVCVEKQGKSGVFLIPSLGLEAVLTPEKMPGLNESIRVKAGIISIPTLEVTFIEA